jgi:hypothetical protein
MKYLAKKTSYKSWLLFTLTIGLVPMAGFEPARLASPPPQDGVSTNFTTSA